MKTAYDKGSLTLTGTVAMGTGVMIGAGIFALTGQVAELAGSLFPLAFLLAGIVSAFSAYSYIKVTRKYPSAGGIAMILQKAYGASTVTGACALLMAFSMIINESLVARTFATYTLQLFAERPDGMLASVLAVALIIVAFLINIAGNMVIGTVSKVAAVVKIGGILAFAGAALWATGFSFQSAAPSNGTHDSLTGFIAGLAVAVLAYKGFTTITNSGGEVHDPHRNVGRAIMISLAICAIVYLLVVFAAASSLRVSEIVAAKNFSLAEAARPTLGTLGTTFTIVIAIIATASGLLASMFAVSRMLAMLTEMQIIPHSHFGMPGTIQKHTLVYTAVLAAALAAFFDLTRIAALGAILYLVMDIAIQWGVFAHLRKDVDARAWILISAIAFDGAALVALLLIKIRSDSLIVAFAALLVAAIFMFEKFYLSNRRLAATPHSGH